MILNRGNIAYTPKQSKSTRENVVAKSMNQCRHLKFWPNSHFEGSFKFIVHTNLEMLKKHIQANLMCSCTKLAHNMIDMLIKQRVNHRNEPRKLNSFPTISSKFDSFKNGKQNISLHFLNKWFPLLLKTLSSCSVDVSAFRHSKHPAEE